MIFVGTDESQHTAIAALTQNIMRRFRGCFCFIAVLIVSNFSFAAAPTAPQNLKVTINTPYSALVEWDASTNADDNTRYVLTRDSASIGVHKTTSFLDNALLPDRTFVYTVTAQNILGQRSSTSTISVTMPSKPATQAVTSAGVQAPTGIRAERYSENSLELFWDRVNTTYLRYEVIRNDQLLSQLDGVSFFDRLPTASAPYRYEVVAIDQQGNRSSPATLSINSTASEEPVAPQNSSTGLIANPDQLKLSVYSSTAAELFWIRPAIQPIGLTQVEIFRDGTLLGLTDGTSYMDTTRTRQDHQYRLVTLHDGERSSGVLIPAENSVTSTSTSSGTTRFIDAVKPQIPVKADRSEGLDVFLLNGQSNANPSFLNAMTEHLSARGFNYLTAHYYVGGQPLSTWIAEDGTKALRWPIMMNVFDGATALCENNRQDIRSITLVHYQGEADVNTTEALIAVSNNTSTPFKRRLSAFTTEFTRHFEARCGITPNIALAIISFNEQHSLFPSHLTGAHALIRKDISDVAREQANVGAFDTLDLDHADHVHLALYPENQAQFIAAERAINLFYEP